MGYGLRWEHVTMKRPVISERGGRVSLTRLTWQALTGVALPLAVVALFAGWASQDRSLPVPVAPINAPLVLAAITFAIALVVRALRRGLGMEGRAALALPDPLYALYLAAIILAGIPNAVLLALLTPFVEGAPDLLRAPASIRTVLRRSACAGVTTLCAGIVYLNISDPFVARIQTLRAHFIGAVAASVVMFVGVAVMRALEEQPTLGQFSATVARYFSSSALGFQALLLSIGPLLPLAEQLDDVEAEFAWTLFLVPLCAVYFLALVSVRLQQRTGELQDTIAQLGVARRREAELTDYAALITRAQEDERRRLARELHDDTAQALIALARGLDALSTRAVDPPLSSYDTRFVGELGELAKRTLESVRRACQDLRPSVLDDLGLSAALESLAHAMSQRGLPCTFRQIGPSHACAPEVEVTIYRIAQEALSNTRQHAHAASAAVEITYGPETVELRVTDDGSGFDHGALIRAHKRASDDGNGAGDAETEGEARAGLGLLGMRERASLIGARLRIESAPDHGTEVALSAPALLVESHPRLRRASV
jgi:signal transduction histidine kinase